MVIRKKRQRYKSAAINICRENNRTINLDNWEEIWDLLDQYGDITYVYFIGDAQQQFVKIGKSNNPGLRLKSIQTGYPIKLFLYKFVPEKSPMTEKELHTKFKHLCTHGEWFKYTEELANFVKSL